MMALAWLARLQGATPCDSDPQMQTWVSLGEQGKGQLSSPLEAGKAQLGGGVRAGLGKLTSEQFVQVSICVKLNPLACFRGHLACGYSLHGTL